MFLYLYFLMVDGVYISKSSDVGRDPKLKFTRLITEARYWDNLSSVRGVNTCLNNRGYKSYIVRAKVEIENIFGETI
jgi:hypothetical protein